MAISDVLEFFLPLFMLSYNNMFRSCYFLYVSLSQDRLRVCPLDGNIVFKRLELYIVGFSIFSEWRID